MKSESASQRIISKGKIAALEEKLVLDKKKVKVMSEEKKCYTFQAIDLS